MIKEIHLQDLREHCLDLLMKTYTALGQTPNEATVLAMSLLLAEDLKRRYKTLTWEAVELAFYNGVRDTDKFHINAQTWCLWLNTTRQLIWDGHYNDEQNNFHAITHDIKKILKNKDQKQITTKSKQS